MGYFGGIKALGGEGKRDDVLQGMTQRFKQSGELTEEDVKRTEPSGANAWQHRLDTIRAQVLVLRGWLDADAPGEIWRLTPAAWAGFFTVRAIDLSSELDSWAARLSESAEKAAGFQNLNRAEIVQKIKDMAETLKSPDEVGEMPNDFASYCLSYLSGIAIKSL